MRKTITADDRTWLASIGLRFPSVADERAWSIEVLRRAGITVPEDNP